MGRAVRQVSETTTRYYWYPGQRKEWLRAALAFASGAAGFGFLLLLTGDLLPATVVGTGVVTALTGVNFGRRDVRALLSVPEPGDRRAMAAYLGRTAWRGLALGGGIAISVVIIANLSTHGFVADWILPAVPAVVGVLAREVGMLWERLSVSGSTSGPAAASRASGPAAAARQRPAGGHDADQAAGPFAG